MESESVFSYHKNLLTIGDFLSIDIYHMKPGTTEGKHYHKGIELVYVIKGICKTHQEGKLYFYKSHQIHEEINDSKAEVHFLCLTIPKETIKNTIYI